MSVSEFLSIWAHNILEGIQGNTFSGRDFIWALMTNHEHHYIQLLNDVHSEHPIWNVHKQIGRYLADHADELGIVSINEREHSTSPFGNESSTMMWEKVRH
jgi:hypothetical protein